MPNRYRLWLRRSAVTALIIFLVINIIAFTHAYNFTHFSNEGVVRTKDPRELSVVDKMKVLFAGIDNPRPKTKALPDVPFDRVCVGENEHAMRGWYLPNDGANEVVIMFHGYAGEKSSLLERARCFGAMGYDVVMVDFLGSGESDGSSTSIGYWEAGQVKQWYDFVSAKYKKPVILFGTSMGAAAILKSLSDVN